MPPLTRWFVKSALIYFVLALLLGLVVAARPVLSLPAYLAALGPVQTHLLMVGWITQLIFGVAHWMFPKYSRVQPRGQESLIWIAFIGLNLGLPLRIIAEPAQAVQPGPMWVGLLTLSAILQGIAGLAFVINSWGRVKER